MIILGLPRPNNVMGKQVFMDNVVDAVTVADDPASTKITAKWAEFSAVPSFHINHPVAVIFIFLSSG